MKVIMLDFDGVLNSARSFKKETKLNQKDSNRKVKVNETLCPTATKNLKDLMDQIPDLCIVISSTWRNLFTLDWLKDKLASYGIDSSKVIGITPGNDTNYRGYEIWAWLATNYEVKEYVILDDNPIGPPNNPTLDHGFRFVQTNWNDGLLPKHIKKVLDIFAIKKE